MKFKHWAVVALVIVALLFLLHNYQMHGGTSGIKSGLGLGNFGRKGQAS